MSARKVLWGGVLFSVLVLLAEIAPYPSRRWVEDESWYSIPSYTLLREGALRNPTFASTDGEWQADTRPPLTPLTLAASFQLLGIGPVQARLPSMLAGIACVVLVGLLGQLLAGPWAGAIAALVLATDTFFVVSCRTARPEAMVTFWSLLAYVLYLHGRRTPAKLWWTAGAALAAGAAVNAHVPGLATVAGLGLVILADAGWKFWKDLRPWVFGAVFLLTLVPFAVWIRSDAKRVDSFHRMYGRGEGETTASKIAREKTRYLDVIGLGSQRVPLPVQVPLRAHVAAATLAAFVILGLYNRPVFWLLLALLLPLPLSWVYLVNKTSRYFAMTAPLCAAAIAAALVLLKSRSPKLYPWAVAAVAICVLTQAAGNGYLLWRSRQANYAAVSEQLRAIVPEGRPVYGSIVFAMGLNDRRYISYDRTKPMQAKDMGAEYYIIGDRVMARGSGYGTDDYAGLRQQLMPYLEGECEIAGRAPNPFYGELTVYRCR